jgi:soluble lytic murein transglycosylase-like protein
MFSHDQIIELARKTAVAHALPPSIFLGLVEQESNFDTYAMRFEPAFWSRYEASQLNTESIARATSYGLTQVMGQVARELGFTGRFLSSLCEPATGLDYGARKLAKCFSSSNGDATKALLKYNGGGNLQYAPEVIEKSKKYETST